MRTLAPLVLCCCCLTNSLLAKTPVEHTNQIDDAVIQNWAQKPNHLKGVKGKFSHVRKVSVNGEEKKNHEVSYDFGTSSSGLYAKQIVDGKVEVAAVNLKYGFTAVEKDNDHSFELGQYRTGKLTQRIENEIRDSFEPFLFSGFEICGKTMSELVRSPYFKLGSLTFDADHRFATLTFEYAPPDKSRDTAITGGTVVFDSQNEWNIQSFDCKTVWGSIDGKVDYTKSDGELVPSAFVTQMHGTADSSLSIDRYTLSEFGAVHEGDDAPVHLKDYGLPSPESLRSVPISQRSIPWFLVGNVAFIGILVAGYLATRSKLAR